MAEEKITDPYLDILYTSNVRCPYCGARIVKFSTTCPRCGIHKKQISESSNIRAKEIKKQKTGEKVFMTRYRPNDVMFTTMIMLLVLGMFGAHCFYVGRKIRGWIIVSFLTIGVIGALFPQDWRRAYTEFVPIDYFPFITDWFFGIAIIIWVFDIFAVVFGIFKYPVRLGDKVDDKK